jgi:hypothetical protein
LQIAEQLEDSERKATQLQREFDKLRTNQKSKPTSVDKNLFTPRSLNMSAMSSRTDLSSLARSASTIKLQFGPAKPLLKENLDGSVDERKQMRSSLMSVTAPFKTKIETTRPALIKKLNLQVVNNSKEED